MPYESPLYDFLDDLDLQHYHQEFVNKLGVTALDHLTYVQQDDVNQLGMSQPEWRRLRASMKKVKKAKKGGKNVTKPPPPLSRMTAPGPGGPPSGGHIIPATDINILDKELGRGEFGKVMQGVWSNREGNQIPVAVKCLSPEKLSLDKCQQDFLKEAAIMHSLNHEHLVKLYGVVLDVDSSLMLVTEFAPLRSLAENMKQEALKPAFPITLLLDFSVQITDAMRYLHMSNIIHRDLAARNILLFVDDEGNKKAKISDFGLSRRLLLGENYRSEMRPNLKLPLAWMPVESLTKLTFTKASDVWSFGVTMWEMFSYGRKPFAHLSGEEILKTIDKPRLERLERPEACPLKIYELMLRCWTHEPESRMSFAELNEELPKARPMQVKTLVNYVAVHPEELTFRAEDILSVVEANDDTGVWKGINPMGKIGYFQRVDTVALGNSQMGKLKRWRSGRSSKTENRRSKLSLEDISKPKDYKHIFHVGVDGKVEGDPTFGGDYRNIPKTDEEDEEEGSSPSRSSSTSGRSDSKSSTPSKSPNKSKKNNKKNISAPVIELSKDTILPPPNGFDSGSTVSVPDVVPSVTQQVSSAPPPIPRQPPQKPQPQQKVQKAPIAVLAEPEVTFTNGTDSTHKQDCREDKKDGDLSSFDMGSLLDDMMSVWDSAKLNLSFSDDLEPTPEEEPDDFMEEEDSLLEGEENAFCNGNTSLSPPTLSVGTVNPVAMEVTNEVAEVEAVNEEEEAEDAELGAVGGVSAAGVSTTGKSAEGSILSGNIIIKDSMTKPTKTFRKVPRQTEEGEANEGVAKPEIRPQEQSQAPRSRLGMDMNIARQMSREKRWDNEFKRLSSSPKDKSSDNEYIDTKTMNQKVDKLSEYEELALASSPQPYTLRDNVLDSANVMRVPRYTDVSRSVSLRTTRPGTDHIDSRVEVELNRSRSLREPPVSPLGQQAYDSLVGGDISGNLRRKRHDAPERKPPMVPPKPAPKPPSRVKTPDVSGDGRFRNGEARLSGSSSQRSYSGTSSDDGMSEDNPNIQGTSGDIAGKSGAVASLRQRFNTNQTEDAPPRPPPREPTDTKVSSFSGVRLRRREQTNGTNENFYASEPDNNNAFTPSQKFSSTTLQNLEQHMPRRVRRSVGEDRIKRRNSSDASDSDTDVAKTRTDRVWSTSGRAASEGDSSSDETVGSNRLSTSSTERSSYSETQSSSGYKSPPRSLYDLPEDQTNSTSSRADQPLSPEEPLSMDHRPPPLPPRVASDSTTTTHRKAPDRPPSSGRDAHWTRPREAGGHNGDIPQNAVPPPRPVRHDIYDRLPRGRTVDMGEHALDSQKRADRPDYDVLPVPRPVWNQNKSYSMDGADSDDYMVGSAASLRQLLRQTNVSSNENVNNNHDEIDCDADNLEDMPDMSPPPVPTTRKSFIDSTYGESPFVQRSETPDTSVAPVQRHSIREPDYVMMKPQSVQDLKREYTQLSTADSEYNVPISHKHTSQNNNASPNQNNAANARYLSDKDKAIYLLMHPKRSSQQSNNSSHNFTRTKSAHLVRRPAFLRAARTPEQRRGTVSASTRLKDADGSSSLPRSEQSAGEGHKMRRSRSTDDILKDGDWAMPEEAESLQDLLARAHISPTDHHSTKDPRSNYLVPPSARRKLPSPDAHQLTRSTPPPSSHTHPHPLNQTPPSSGYHGEAAYLDMSQNSLERKKKNEQEKVASNQNEPVQTSSEHSSSSSSSQAFTTKPVSSKGNRLSYPPISSSNQTKAVSSKYVYDPNDDEVDL